jgi:hypothetical protein
MCKRRGTSGPVLGSDAFDAGLKLKVPISIRCQKEERTPYYSTRIFLPHQKLAEHLSRRRQHPFRQLCFPLSLVIWRYKPQLGQWGVVIVVVVAAIVMAEWGSRQLERLPRKQNKNKAPECPALCACVRTCVRVWAAVGRARMGLFKRPKLFN